MTAKYKAVVTQEVVQVASVWSAKGCAQYSMRNVGNVNCSIDGVNVLLPGETWEGPQMHPDVAYYSTHKIEFDLANAPAIRMPVGGAYPPSTVVLPGDVVVLDTRLIISKSNID